MLENLLKIKSKYPDKYEEVLKEGLSYFKFLNKNKELLKFDALCITAEKI